MPASKEERNRASNLADQFLLTSERFSRRLALWAEEGTYSYGDLQKAALGIAHVLSLNARTTPQNCAILAHRSRTAYAGIAGCLLSGHAYIALSPKHPIHRLETILDQSEATSIVIDGKCSSMAHLLLERCRNSMRVLMPDHNDAPEWTRRCPRHRFYYRSDFLNQGELKPTAQSSDTAYIMFTSGSTGVPKGVVISHANVMAYSQAMIERYGYCSDDRLIHLPELSFDLSVHDLFVAWASGASLFSVPERELMLPDDFVRRHALTGWTSVPSAVAYLKQFNKLKPGCFEGLRVSVFCGEPFSGQLASDWCAAAPNAVVDNLYGPTEATVAFTGYSCSNGVDFSILPLGEPFPGLEVAVCDETPTPVPPGEIGELFLGGIQVAQGYWQDDEMTKRQFIERTFSGKVSERWYRTGDLVSYDARVGLIYKGRLTRQVKIRGYRVELTEIEAVLRRNLKTEFTAVIPCMNESKTADYLVAYVETVDDFIEDDVKGACEADLPSYMIPRRLFRLNKMPLTENGKTNYETLEAMFREMAP
ncbi:MAG: hypothetical protein A3G18_08700 [Rhodospirillales bacterium RIFCSPLOWO2_12_FULL_58_28]|nr:MAG: hypothetical protein A3H92_00255 [Rhodospirillales bacterium RIFCSPLOWO2_02_FULL_58_16]OHC79795.1 MAG: hypothetical protein A3G18_08700 [Rhodospirillales bacterium RIFCSPLOWO2_12_FULL_58_28]